MKTTYELHTAARCPIDGAQILYDLAITLTTASLPASIEVERLIPAVAAVTIDAVMQEPLTLLILEAVQPLVADHVEVEVRTVGTHSGVRITCTA